MIYCLIMPLLMLDLDNTLVDRDAAFRDAATALMIEYGLPDTDLEWLMSIDASGYASRRCVATAMAGRYGDRLPENVIVNFLDHGAANHVVLSDSACAAVEKAIAGGWTCVIVTNGRVSQQETKIRNTGLDRLVHGWVVSEAIGHSKPEPEIFVAAARIVNASLCGAWMIGDSPHADIAGAHRLGIPSVWLSAGQPWIEDSYRPTYIADSVASAIGDVVNLARPNANSSQREPGPRDLS